MANKELVQAVNMAAGDLGMVARWMVLNPVVDGFEGSVTVE